MHHKKKTLISVLMGSLYGRKNLFLLQRSIDSILAQSFDCFEFLICDDGSTHGAKRLVEEYAKRDPRIRMIRPGNKFDLAAKLNACLKEAKGEYIARMDDDDFSHPERFQKQLQALSENIEIDFAGSNVRLVQVVHREGSDDHVTSRRIGIRKLPEFPTVRDFLMTQPFIHPALMFRRSALEAVGGYSEDKHQILCEDYDLLLRMYAKGFRGMNLQEELLDYTVPADGKGPRRMRHRMNEAITRFARFKELDLLPKALPYVVKPILVGLLPGRVADRLKSIAITDNRS